MKRYAVIERVFGRDAPTTEFLRSLWETKEEADKEAKRLTCLYEENKKKYPGGPDAWFRVKDVEVKE